MVWASTQLPHGGKIQGKTHLAADALASSAWPGGLVGSSLVESFKPKNVSNEKKGHLVVLSMGMNIFTIIRNPFFFNNHHNGKVRRCFFCFAAQVATLLDVYAL